MTTEDTDIIAQTGSNNDKGNVKKQVMNETVSQANESSRHVPWFSSYPKAPVAWDPMS